MMAMLAIALSITVNLVQAQELRFASWNMEHLAEKNGEGCVPRTNKEYRAMKRFAADLNVDVVALQEVENAEAIARVFPPRKWDIIVSDRPASGSYKCRGSEQQSTQQRVAMVVRKNVDYDNLGSYEELAIHNPGLRYGVLVRINGAKDTVDVMGVHMKSGCFVNDFTASDRKACKTLEEQVPVLDQWIESHISAGKQFVVMGDFNHRLTTPDNKLWEVLTEMDGEKVKLVNSMQNLEGCHPKYPAPIDHIIMGPKASKLHVPGSETVHYFPSANGTMAQEEMYSDHCPISMQLKLN